MDSRKIRLDSQILNNRSNNSYNIGELYNDSLYNFYDLSANVYPNEIPIYPFYTQVNKTFFIDMNEYSLVVDNFDRGRIDFDYLVSSVYFDIKNGVKNLISENIYKYEDVYVYNNFLSIYLVARRDDMRRDLHVNVQFIRQGGIAEQRILIK